MPHLENLEVKNFTILKIQRNFGKRILLKSTYIDYSYLRKQRI